MKPPYKSMLPATAWTIAGIPYRMVAILWFCFWVAGYELLRYAGFFKKGEEK